MFSDLVGSTALSARMDPEDLREVISAYQKCVAETVQRFGGYVAKLMGDGVLIFFGYPQAHEDDAERAVRAGLQFGHIADAVATSLEGSLSRLSRECVDIFHLHNPITDAGGGEALSVRQVLEDVVPAFERLRQQGKTRFLGLTAIGDTTALHRVIDTHAFDSAQVVYNLLNPSAATELPPNYPAQDYGRLFDHTTAAGVGVVGILAGGALSGSTERHPIASPPPEPIGSAMTYEADVLRAQRLLALVKEGFAASLTEAATRFAISHSAVGTILVGMATPHQFEDALAAIQKGPLPSAALDRLSGLQHTFAGEPR
jgi:aryl-alcohol dehydrogenase-like predicted oxidoreductase